MEPSIVRNKIDKLKICVLIPTYNNHKTLERVIDGVLLYTDNVIVINDGSTDTTATILEKYTSISVLTIEKNKGKGNALQIGFRDAISKGYEYAITIDSDGQHFPHDIPDFVTKLEENQLVLLIGSRQMEQDGIPKKSSFGNKFSNFWFWFETGIKLEDTQSGFRLYPLNYLPKKFWTNKFEFEIEIIVRTAWKGIDVINIQIDILYDPNERVSHFRPFKDFTRISILNTFLVFVTIFYIKPRNFLFSFKKKNIKTFFKEDILGSNDTNKVKALSIALGVFLGIAPLWGFQTFLAIFLASMFRLNKVISFFFSNVSIPPMIPIIIYLSLLTGSLILQDKMEFDFEVISFEIIKKNLLRYVIGSFAFATFCSILSGIVSYFILSFFSQKTVKNA
ncbi:Poly-beta-1,6-N-acetyl-D-glucosamine synthase [Algoriella xinjiangensis]|uniref:DUF2062 domain-containing protein n=1 Tax=Algoriella xinjiangensis TaxID=684065 RepID=UPI000F64189A|nr:DUF2062 domain-containing protein [Algoriella xinjiangensis]VDH14753.1 Poly-beta-1,6-N-acetyl-D-glucosamine synthase [Algoriella xinjiangensis]